MKVLHNLQDDAEALIEESGLITLLETFGKVSVQGSYRYRLMTIPDIDIYVIGPETGRSHAKALLSTLIDQGFWNAFMFGDWVHFDREEFPSGYYIGLKRTFRCRRWKVDIWDLVEEPAGNSEFAERMSHLEDEEREAILNIKRWRDAEGYRIGSKQIYDAVLSGQAKDLLSFKRLIALE